MFHWGNYSDVFGNTLFQLAPFALLAFALGWAAWRTRSVYLSWGMYLMHNPL